MRSLGSALAFLQLVEELTGFAPESLVADNIGYHRDARTVLHLGAGHPHHLAHVLAGERLRGRIRAELAGFDVGDAGFDAVAMARGFRRYGEGSKCD
jgi:hypothetical protein